MKNILFLDVETTGLSSAKHEIIQLAGIIIVDNIVKEEFSFYFKPKKLDTIEQSALRVTGLTIEKLLSYSDDPRETLNKIDKMLKKYAPINECWTIGAQNTRFDYAFFKKWWEENQTISAKLFDKIFMRKYIDLISTAREANKKGLYKFENYKLKTILETLGLSFNGRAHNALVDIKATFEAYALLENSLSIGQEPIVENTNPEDGKVDMTILF